MAVDSDSFSFDNHIPDERSGHLFNLDPLASEQIPFPHDTLESALASTSADPVYQYELLLMETLPLPTAEAVTFVPPKFRRIPQGRYKLKQWDYTPVAPIFFQVNGYPGLNMGDALRKKFTALEGRDDLVLQDAGRTFSCRFLFPGYPPNKSPQIFTKFWNKERDSITRSTLAHHVARKLKRYFDSMSSSYTMDPSTSEQWKIGEGFMHLDNMFLAKLESVSKGSFQPEIWVVDPMM